MMGRDTGFTLVTLIILVRDWMDLVMGQCMCTKNQNGAWSAFFFLCPCTLYAVPVVRPAPIIITPKRRPVTSSANIYTTPQKSN